MKTIVVGDTHGRAWWKYISQTEKWDKFIFIGDYFDSFNIDGQTQINNFKDIIQFKKDNPDKVVLLIGNHDFHYLNVDERYSGFQIGMQYMIRDLIEKNLEYMQMCYIQDKYLFTHAGVTNTWLEAQEYYPKKMSEKRGLEQFINDLFTYQPFAFKFNGRNDYGDDITQSPIWVRPASLSADMVKGYCHVVGHTQVKKIYPKEDMILIDALEQDQEYLVIEDDKVIVQRVDRF